MYKRQVSGFMCVFTCRLLCVREVLRLESLRYTFFNTFLLYFLIFSEIQFFNLIEFMFIQSVYYGNGGMTSEIRTDSMHKQEICY